MDSTRIKIGQILYGQKEGSEDIAIVKVESVGIGGINYNDTDNSFQYSFDDLFGIPVAANVLRTSGFTLINGMYVNDNIGFIKIKQINDQWFWYADKDKCILVKYLHELQGLYGELTGNVLAVDEDALSRALNSPVVLSAPTGFATSDMTQNTVTITWDGDDDAGGYSYQIDYGNWVAADAAEIQLTGLSGSTTYTLRVKSISDDELFVDSPESEEFKFTTNPLIVLTAPADLTASVIGENNITITWSEVEHASSYEVQIGETTDTTEELIYEFTTLTVNTVYNMSVKAVGDGVTYADSVVAELTKTTLKEKLGTPTVTGEALGTDSVKFSWIAIDHADSYSYSTDAWVTSYTTEDLEVTLTGLTLGTPYTISVKAIAEAGSDYRDSDPGEGYVSTNPE
jgi:hypothetical protein